MGVALLAGAALGGDHTSQLRPGKADLKSAGPLAFGPEGILFVGDSMGASVYALDTGDRVAGGGGAVEIHGINQKIAALTGTSPEEILVNDVAVNPISRKTYLSVSRGRGPDAAPVLIRVDAKGKLEALDLDAIRHSRVSLPNAPDSSATDRRGRRLRVEAITDLAYVDGRVFVAGLSNEEFASKLRSVPFPFETQADSGTSVEIYHGSHGRFETNSPVRTFVPYRIKNEPHILAAYTCTPLVKFPVASLEPGKKVVGTTIAELGNQNRPLDMIVYRRGGADYILMNNSSRGVMKMSTEKIETYAAITEKTDVRGLPFETIAQLKGVEHLDRFDDANALLLVRTEGGSLDLKTVALP
jgi:hypothetical protein